MFFRWTEEVMGIESTVSSGGGNHSTFEAEEGKAEQDTLRTLGDN